MEPLFLLLVAAVLFIHAWYLLGLCADPRTMGLIAGALALGLLLTAAAGGLSAPLLIDPATAPLVTAMRGFVLLWAVYAAAVSAHGLWGFEERTLGFYSVLLWAVSLVMVGLPWRFSEAEVSTPAALAMSVAFLILALLSAVVFFHLAFRFRQVRGVTGWFLLVGSIVIGGLGLAAYFPPIT